MSIRQPYQELKPLLLVVILCLMFIACIWYEQHQGQKLLKQVQAGEVSLICQLANGATSVEPEKVVSFLNDTWQFTNGYSTKCKTLKK